MKVEDFISVIGADFYTGVPDSLLKPLCNYLLHKYGNKGKQHVIAANEGNAVAIAAGYYLATGQIPVVYMQNSGQGNVVNPYASLLHPDVYAIPEIFVIGWRGEPGIKDEPQHKFQGKVTLSLLDTLGIAYIIIDHDTSVSELKQAMIRFATNLSKGKSVAVVVKKNALTYDATVNYSNKYNRTREAILQTILQCAGSDIIVSTTGKTSREIFELREQCGQTHENDFLTVGSMGHTSSIALGMALQKPNKRIWCIDGDGGALMHMGAMALIGQQSPQNLVHIIINNEAHESVGGFPTAAGNVDFVKIAAACGYKKSVYADEDVDLPKLLNEIKLFKGLRFVEIKSAIGSRKDLGRPKETPQVAKANFMQSFLDS